MQAAASKGNSLQFSASPASCLELRNCLPRKPGEQKALIERNVTIPLVLKLVAAEKGHLAELQDRMDEISRREGLSLDQFWPAGEGPADY